MLLLTDFQESLTADPTVMCEVGSSPASAFLIRAYRPVALRTSKPHSLVVLLMSASLLEELVHLVRPIDADQVPRRIETFQNAVPRC